MQSCMKFGIATGAVDINYTEALALGQFMSAFSTIRMACCCLCHSLLVCV